MSKYLSGTKIFNSSGTVSTTITDSLFSTIVPFVITDSTLSTSSTTGSIYVSGGLGVAKNVWVGTSYSGGVLASSNVRGMVFNSPTITLTDNALGAGTITNANSIAFAQLTLATTTNAITATNAATLYIAGAPIAGTNMTITNSYALQIAAGRSVFSDSTASSSTTTGALVVTGGVGIGGNLNVGGSAATGALSASTISGTSATLSATSNQITLGTTNTVTLSAAAPAASRTYTIPNVGGNASFLTTAATYTGQNSAGITLNNNQTINTASYLNGCSIFIGSNTVTDNVTAANGSVSLFADVYIGGKFLNATNTNITYTDVTALYLHGTINIGGGNITARQSALLINSGHIRLFNGSFITYSFGTLGIPSLYLVGVGGLYGVTGFKMGMSVNSTLVQSWTTTQSQFPITGTASAPSIYFGTSTNTGIYAPSSGSIAISSAGSNIWTTSATGLSVLASTASSSTTSGAVTVTGGVGIGGDLYVGGTIFGTVNGTINTAAISLSSTSDQITLNSSTGNTVKLTAPTFAAARTYTIRDAGGNADFIMSTFGSTQSIAGGLTSSNLLTASNGFTLTTGALNLTSTSGAIALTGTTFTTNNPITTTSSTTSTSTSTGALITTGGAGIGGNLYVGGLINGASTITSAGILTASNGFTLTTGALNLTSTSGAISLTGTTFTTNNPISTTSTTIATSSSSGALISSGGASITKNLWIGTSYIDTLFATSNVRGTIINCPNITLTDNAIAAGTISNINVVTLGQVIYATVANAVTATNAATLHIVGSPTGGTNVTISNSYAIQVASGRSLFADSTASTSTTSGAVIITGGAGIGGNLYVGGLINGASTITSASTLTASNGFTLTTGALNLTSTSGAIALTSTTFTTNNPLITTSTTTSTSTATGALQVSGGAGIVGNLYVGGSINGASGLVITSGNINMSSSSGTFSTPTGAVTLGSGDITTSGTLIIGKNNILTPFSVTGTSSPQTLAASATGTLIILNTSGNITLNLPSSPPNGTRFMIINTANFTVTLSTNSSSVYFDGDSLITSINMIQYDRIHIIYQGTNWYTF